jgi:hypothetical protein
METAKKSINYVSIIAGSAFMLSIASNGFLWNAKKSSEEELLAERLQTKTLIASKELLQNDLIKAESNLQKKIGSEKLLNENEVVLLSKIAALEANIKKNASGDKKLIATNEKLKKLKLELADVRERYISQQSKWENEKNSLNTQLAQLERNNLSFTEKLNKVKAPNADYFRIEALRGKKNKQTRMAKRTHKILVSFNLNEAIPSNNGTVYLSLKGPNNERLPSQHLEMLQLMKDEESVQVPIHAKSPLKHVSKGRQEILLETTTKLKPGVYQADIFTENTHIGGAQIKLD